MISKSPCISVIMSVYNAEKYVGDCIRSILGQTFSDFEFIIINDASTDSSPEIIKSFKDKRIRLLNNRERRYPTRNKGLRVARGKYICIMDADDISLPHRFERQVLFMEQHPQYGLAGSGYRVLGKDKDLYRESDYEKIKVQLIRNNCFIHPSVIIRHDLLKKHKLRYIRKYYYSSDYDFLARAARYFPVTNIPEVLMHYRVHEGQVTIQYRKRQAELADEISIDQLRFIGIKPTKQETRLHLSFQKGIPVDYSQKLKLHNWLDRIRGANLKAGFYDKNELEAFFEALLMMQPYCKNNFKTLPEKQRTEETIREDLTDVTFVIPVRITSDHVVENLNTTIGFLKQHFNTNFYVLEADKEQRYFPITNQKEIKYVFITDDNPFFHRTKWINRLLKSVDTPYVAVWESGAIVMPDQVKNAVEILRYSDAILSIPFSEKIYKCDQLSSGLFGKSMKLKVLNMMATVMPVESNRKNEGQVFLVNRKRYLAKGGENEKLFGKEMENVVRLKLMDVLNMTVNHSAGPLFCLWHPDSGISKNNQKHREILNLKELLNTCKYAEA